MVEKIVDKRHIVNVHYLYFQLVRSLAKLFVFVCWNGLIEISRVCRCSVIHVYSFVSSLFGKILLGSTAIITSVLICE